MCAEWKFAWAPKIKICPAFSEILAHIYLGEDQKTKKSLRRNLVIFFPGDSESRRQIQLKIENKKTGFHHKSDHLDFKLNFSILLPTKSTYLPCLINTYAVCDRTEVLRGDSRLSARSRSLKRTKIKIKKKTSIWVDVLSFKELNALQTP